MFITKSLRVTLFLALLALTVGAVGVEQVAAKTVVAPKTVVSPYTAAQIVAEINNERIAQKLAPLTSNAALTAAAQMKVNDMVVNSYFAHYSPTGVAPWYWMDKAGYEFIHASENLASGFKTTKSLVKGWMNSPTHKANIMGTQFTETGVAFAKVRQNGVTVWYVVQMFGAQFGS